RRGHELEVQQQRDLAGEREAQAEEHQHGRDDAARRDRAEQELAAARVETRPAAGAELAPPRHARGEAGPEAEQARQREGAEAPEQELAGRRGRSEERRRRERQSDAVHVASSRRARATRRIGGMSSLPEGYIPAAGRDSLLPIYDPFFRLVM